MKRIARRVAVLMAAVMLCSMMMGFSAYADYAGISKDFYKGNGATYAMPITKPVHTFETWVGYGGTLSVKTSNMYVVDGYKIYEMVPTTKYGNVRADGYELTPKGVGTAKISVTYQYKDLSNISRSASMSFTLRTYKWTNPFATLKIGKKNFKKAFKKTDEKTIKPVKGRLKIKMNKKYKLSKVLYQANGSDSWKKIGKKSKVKLNHGDKLRFQFRDNKHHVSNATATFTIG